MLFSSPVYSQVSGSIAGITYFHGRSGLATRARSTPVNPNTARQRTIRHAIATLGSYWGQTLTGTERAAWRLYASNVPWTNPLGQTTFLTGQQHFTRCNVPRIQADIAILAAAPTIYDLGTWTAPTIFAAHETPPSITISFDKTDDWASTVGGFMIVYGGRPTGQGQNFFGGPYRYGDKYSGKPGPPGSPATIIYPWPISVGQRVWAYVRIIQIDARLSLPIVLGPETVVP